MKRTALILTLLALLSVFGCSRTPQQPQTDYVLYFPPAAGVSHGSALVAQPWERKSEEAPDPDEMLRALLAGPTQEGLISPFPQSVYLVRTEWDAQEPGKLVVRLSEAYSNLANMALTLADYSIVLTLSQLEGVAEVEISSSAYTAGYRSHTDLSAGEAELVDPLLSSAINS